MVRVNVPTARSVLSLLSPKPSKKELEASKKDAEARARQEWERAIPLGGNPADVYGIDVAWSIGDIAENGIGSSRRKVLEQLSSTWAAGDDAGQQMEQMILKSRNSLREVLERASRGEAVRIWYSHNPDEICGFYWLLTQFQSVSTHGPIYSCPQSAQYMLSNCRNGNILIKTRFVLISDGAKYLRGNGDGIFPCSRK